jgi:hypothetical protein
MPQSASLRDIEFQLSEPSIGHTNLDYVYRAPEQEFRDTHKLFGKTQTRRKAIKPIEIPDFDRMKSRHDYELVARAPSIVYFYAPFAVAVFATTLFLGEWLHGNQVVLRIVMFGYGFLAALARARSAALDIGVPRWCRISFIQPEIERKHLNFLAAILSASLAILVFFAFP